MVLASNSTSVFWPTSVDPPSRLETGATSALFGRAQRPLLLSAFCLLPFTHLTVSPSHRRPDNRALTGEINNTTLRFILADKVDWLALMFV